MKRLTDGVASAPFSDVARKRLAMPIRLVQYLKHLGTERRLSPHTATNYARDLRALADFMERGNLADWGKVDSQHVRVFAARAHAGGLSPRSVQRRLSAVRGFFNYLVRERVVASNPAVDIRAPEGGATPARHARCRPAKPPARHSAR